MSRSRRPRKTVNAGPGPAANAGLTPNREGLRVGEETAAGRQPAGARAERPVRVPFGSYLPPDLQRQFKAACVLQGVEMQDGLEEAIRLWLDQIAD